MLKAYIYIVSAAMLANVNTLSAGELSACTLSAKPIDCYSDYVITHEGQESADEALQKAIEHLETTADEKTKILLASQILEKVGKHHLSYFPPYLRFYLSGPNHLEIFRLIELKQQGVSDADLIKIILTAKGTYGHIGERGTEILKSKHFTPLHIRILTHHQFLKSGDKIKIDDLRMLIGSRAPEKEKLEIIALSNIKNIKLTDEKSALLKELGFSDAQLKTLKYNQLLRDGPSQYSVWKIIQDHGNNIGDSSIIKKISSTGWYYKNFNENEIEVIRSYGVSKAVMQAMTKQTTTFFSDVEKVSNKSEKRDQTENIVYDKTLKYVNSYQQNNALMRGVSVNLANNDAKEDSLTDKAKNCVMQKAALKACEHVPFPLGYGCNALAKNKYDCPI